MSETQITFDDYKQRKPAMSATTRELYGKSIERLYTRGGERFTLYPKGCLNFLEDYGTCIELLEKHFFNISTQRQQLAICQSISHTMGFVEASLKFTEKMSIAYDKMKKEKMEQKYTTSQEKTKITTDEIKMAVKKSQEACKSVMIKPVEDSSFQDYLAVQECVILMLYNMYPLRNDLADCKFVIRQVTKKTFTPDSGTNYIIKKGKSFYLLLNNYKTFKLYLFAKVSDDEIPELVV